MRETSGYCHCGISSADYSATVAVDEQPARRRRTPEAARAEILGSASRLLQGGSLDAMNVSAVMAGTTLSRKAFYVADLAELLVALVSPLRVAADAGLSTWRDGDDPVASGRAALRAAAALYREHGALLNVVLRSPTDDEALLAARTQLLAPLYAVAEQQVRAARPPVDDPVGVAHALATMNVHRLLDAAPGASDADLDALVDAIAVIWERTLFPGGAPK
jgi:AcrR family transcriptional regulator